MKSLISRLFGGKVEQSIVPPPISLAVKCPHCAATPPTYYEAPIHKVVNPNGEYVEGYGHAVVMKQCGTYQWCGACGWRSDGNPTVITRAEMEAM